MRYRRDDQSAALVDSNHNSLQKGQVIGWFKKKKMALKVTLDNPVEGKATETYMKMPGNEHDALRDVWRFFESHPEVNTMKLDVDLPMTVTVERMKT